MVLIVTDGEPTAHIEPEGYAAFDYPPSHRTLGLTVRELDELSKLGAQVTFFKLGEDPGLARFVDGMADGRADASSLPTWTGSARRW